MGAPDLSNWLWPDADLQRQPQGAIAVNPLVLPAAARAFVGGVSVTDTTNVGLPLLLTPNGLGYTGKGASTAGVSIGTSKLTTSNSSGTGDFTILFVTDANTSTFSVIWNATNNGSNGAWIGINGTAYGSSSAGTLSWGTDGGAGILNVSGMIDGTRHTFIFTRVSGTIYCYRDGVQVGSVANANSFYAAGVTEYLGGWYSSGFGMSGNACQLLATSNVGTSPASAVSLTLNPWQIFQPQKLGIRMPSSGSSTVTGTGASTQQVNVSSATGTVLVAGSAAPTQQVNSSSGSGAALISGIAASTQGVNSSSASGSVLVSGTAASTQAVNSSAATGSVTVSGTASSTQNANTSSASGGETVSGSGSSTQNVNASSASGTNPDSGSAASTQQLNTSAASGGNLVSATGSSTQQVNSSAASGLVLVSGSGSSNQAVNLSSASGLVGNVVAGTGSSTQSTNVSAASGSVAVGGSGTSTQLSNVSGGSGGVVVGIVGASTQAANESSASGSVITGLSGTGSSTQSPNASSAQGSLSIVGSAAPQQAGNASAGNGQVQLIATGSQMQNPNMVVAHGQVIDPADFVLAANESSIITASLLVPTMQAFGVESSIAAASLGMTAALRKPVQVTEENRVFPVYRKRILN